RNTAAASRRSSAPKKVWFQALRSKPIQTAAMARPKARVNLSAAARPAGLRKKGRARRRKQRSRPPRWRRAVPRARPPGRPGSAVTVIGSEGQRCAERERAARLDLRLDRVGVGDRGAGGLGGIGRGRTREI